MSLVSKEAPSLVTLDTCAQLAGTDKPFILVLRLGDNLHESVVRAADKMNLKSASISGLGALDDVTVAYYHLDRKEYTTKLFKGMFELISMNGNISFAEGKRTAHIHAALGQPDYSVVGGHIMDGIVGPTCEITVIPFASKIQRQQDDNIGLKLLCSIK